MKFAWSFFSANSTNLTIYENMSPKTEAFDFEVYTRLGRNILNLTLGIYTVVCKIKYFVVLWIVSYRRTLLERNVKSIQTLH